MGQKTPYRRPHGQTTLRKGPVGGGAVGSPPSGCPDEVIVEGRAALEPSMVGQRVSLTLADGVPQLVVGGRVAPISQCRPSLSRVTRCLEEGESYLGTVTQIFAGRFEAILSRGG